MNDEFRKTAPTPLDAVPFNISQPFETRLENGLKIVVFEEKRLPLVSFRLGFPTGDINDPADHTGVNSAMAAMLNEGTKNRSSRQIADEIERLGAGISASSTSDNTILSASSLSLYSSEVLKLLADITLNPNFPENELKIYKQNTIENLKYQRSQPGFLAHEQISRIIYGDHPYSKTTPTAEDIENLTPQILADFHAKLFVPGNAKLIIVGDFDRDRLLKEVENEFGDWESGPIAQFELPQIPERSATTLTIVDRPGSAQSNIILSNPAIDRNHPDYFPLLVMNQVLGAGASARLFMNLREDKGYTYGAYSAIDARRRGGAFEATAEVRTQVTGDSLKEFFYELNRIREEKVPPQELKDAQNFLTGVFPIRAETQEGLTNLITSQQLFDLPDDYLQTYRERVNAITVDDIFRVAGKYIKPDRIAIVIVGDAEEVLTQVAEFSNQIEIFDTTGRPLDPASYGSPDPVENAEVSGVWKLEVDAQGQKLPIKIILNQDGDKIFGEMESMLGTGEISNGKIKGNKFSAIAVSSFQGQEMEIRISGKIEGDEIKGAIETGLPDFPPLPFSGKKGDE
ncbi:MAG: pitrilysin family protein [Pyrinomonadaceae bacterium]